MVNNVNSIKIVFENVENSEKRIELVVCIFRYEIAELGQVDFYELSCYFQKQKLIVFSLMFLQLGDFIKMYDVNQNNFIFTFLYLHMYKHMGWMVIYSKILMSLYFLRIKDKVFLVDIILFYNNPQVQIHHWKSRHFRFWKYNFKSEKST